MSIGNNIANIDLVEKMYARWKSDKTAVTADWGNFFEGFELGHEDSSQVGSRSASGSGAISSDPAMMQLQAHVMGAIYKYRVLGHTQADINPLKVPEKNPQLNLEKLQISTADLQKNCMVGNYSAGPKQMKVGELLKHLEETYCGPIGVEYAHIQDSDKRHWLQQKIEGQKAKRTYTPERKKRILRKILETEVFESFLHTRFVGQKRFSLEGGETTIAAMDALIVKGAEVGIENYVIGMAHRGRLSVMTQILGKEYKKLFVKFGEYVPDTVYGSGDVKYHLGYSNEVEVNGKTVGLHLTPNPSHLELVNPVVEGRARAMQRRTKDKERKKVAAILIHGDAAFIGQGIVAETLNFSKLTGYTTGGTIHLVINNQIGFTTDPWESRSSRYCTEMAKMVESPIFHVNGDDPEAVTWAMELSLEYRQKWGEDVVVDMLCYRKHGHNEGDEPRFTQPELYAQIDKHAQVSKIYGEKLLKEGTLAEGEMESWAKEKVAVLEEHLEATKQKKGLTLPFVPYPKGNTFEDSTQPKPQAKWSFAPVATAVNEERLEKIVTTLTEVPEGFNANAKIARLMQQRRDGWKNNRVDWGLAEQLCWGALVMEGTPVRLSGQDSVRGTFTHRHASWYDVKTNKRYTPLNHVSTEQARFDVHNSSLSEAAVLGFDYGYSLDFPEMLTMWEAQFGDFVNGAQSMIDQYIASSETKWQIHSGLTLLLPHGYEGQGPEHSSARLERFLQLCAEENIQVTNPTTPAQLFHLLRRQMKRGFLKPLIVMTPKSLLRLEECVSTKEEFTRGAWAEIVDERVDAKKIQRVIVCSGKVYYDLAAYKKLNKIDNVALVRVEQMYPFHAEMWAAIAKSYKNAKHWVWCQEEPRNMGAWGYIRDLLEEGCGQKVAYAGRPAAAAPAVGATSIHKLQQAKLIEEAFKV